MMNELLANIWRVIKPLPGWCTKEKSEWLANWINADKPSIVVELGVFGGRSLIAMGLAVQREMQLDPSLRSQVYGIDPYSTIEAIDLVREPEHLEWWSKMDLGKIQEECQQAIVENHLHGLIDMLIDAASNVVSLFDEKSIDLLHIDANHSEEHALEDVTLWLPKVRGGGIIMLDDVDWVSVHSARALLKQQCSLIHSTTTWEVFQKPRSSFAII